MLPRRWKTLPTRSRSPKRGHTYSERLVSLKNETHEYLTIAELRYRTTQNGRAVWRSLPRIELQPGEVHRLKESDGSYVRASQLCLIAEGQRVQFDQHRTEPLDLCERNGPRLYREDTIGAYVHVFRASASPLKSSFK